MNRNKYKAVFSLAFLTSAVLGVACDSPVFP